MEELIMSTDFDLWWAGCFSVQMGALLTAFLLKNKQLNDHHKQRMWLIDWVYEAFELGAITVDELNMVLDTMDDKKGNSWQRYLIGDEWKKWQHRTRKEMRERRQDIKQLGMAIMDERFSDAVEKINRDFLGRV